ncbi:hypothetical protein GDI3861 [Gluconacetobacter diazotrophicus PA1 5]|uniref:Uncharacterized protein n=1 Tax=Gluconacetobacter diazotrophicus (strain ATCC 49037 / DSM 5601 / CCUG 37298 / CIP 103539 / LMG 7603 / PAl5) TaxID=272568 RepID=A9HA75_GLUDA|nr:hypothetical protein GDI3861 [Gluconacetobacter diazotrophicus PA1 5]
MSPCYTIDNSVTGRTVRAAPDPGKTARSPPFSWYRVARPVTLLGKTCPKRPIQPRLAPCVSWPSSPRRPSCGTSCRRPIAGASTGCASRTICSAAPPCSASGDASAPKGNPASISMPIAARPRPPSQPCCGRRSSGAIAPERRRDEGKGEGAPSAGHSIRHSRTEPCGRLALALPAGASGSCTSGRQGGAGGRHAALRSERRAQISHRRRA